MIYGITRTPALAAGIAQMNASSAREQQLKDKVALMEAALSESEKKAEFYKRMWEMQADEGAQLRAEYRRLCRDYVHAVASECAQEKRAQEQRARESEQPRRARTAWSGRFGMGAGK